jgi:hypothetical protein
MIIDENLNMLESAEWQAGASVLPASNKFSNWLASWKPDPSDKARRALETIEFMKMVMDQQIVVPKDVLADFQDDMKRSAAEARANSRRLASSMADQTDAMAVALSAMATRALDRQDAAALSFTGTVPPVLPYEDRGETVTDLVVGTPVPGSKPDGGMVGEIFVDASQGQSFVWTGTEWLALVQSNGTSFSSPILPPLPAGYSQKAEPKRQVAIVPLDSPRKLRL